MTKKKSKKTRAKAKITTVTKATLNGPKIAPINTLPSAILTRIFQCLLNSHTRPCFAEKRNNLPGSLVYPDSLLCICSHWRQVALASPTLWSHIDIMLSLPGSRKLLTRAKSFLGRSEKSPLDIHIIDRPLRAVRPLDKSDDESSNLEIYLSGGFGLGCFDGEDKALTLNDPEALDFIRSIPRRAPVRSIELVMASSIMLNSYGPSLLQCFANCRSGTLTQVISRGKGFVRFIGPGVSTFSPQSPANTLRPLTDKLEAVWLSVTTLHISGGMCPTWNSTSFKGLIDLRLEAIGSIPESQFINILKSSPRLRILKFHVRVTEVRPLNAKVQPIQLDNLEILDVIGKRLGDPEFETLARWIALGQKPLRLSLWSSLGANSVKNFFRRSNVTEFHIRIDEGRDIDVSELETITDLSPGLRMLAVDGCDHGFLSRNTPSRNIGTSHLSTRIDALHLQYCQSIQIDKLRRMIKKHSIQTLTMWSSSLLQENCTAPDKVMSTLCPVVKRLKRREYTPMEEWIDSIV